VDESGFYLLPAAIRTYPPRGETPFMQIFQTLNQLSVMSGITSQGWLFTMTKKGFVGGLVEPPAPPGDASPAS